MPSTKPLGITVGANMVYLGIQHHERRERERIKHLAWDISGDNRDIAMVMVMATDDISIYI